MPLILPKISLKRNIALKIYKPKAVCCGSKKRLLLKEQQHLLIVDRLPASLPQRRLNVSWDILGLGLTREELINGLSLFKEGRKDLRVVNLQPWSKWAGAQVRKFIVPILDDLPRRQISGNHTLGSLLGEKCHKNLWWFLAVSEKNPIRCQIIQDLYYLAIVKRATNCKKYKSVYWMTNDNLLHRTYYGAKDTQVNYINLALSFLHPLFIELLYWIRAFRVVFMVGYLNFFVYILNWKDYLISGSTIIFTVFPYWWINSQSSSAADRFFPEKPKSVFRGSTIYLAWWSAGIRKTWNSRLNWKKVLSKHKINILQRYVTLPELFRLFSPKTFFKLVKFRNIVGRLDWPNFLGFKISRLLEREISRSIAAGDSITGRLIYEATRKVSSIISPDKLIFRFENQPIDRALICSVRGVCPSVGFWHSPFVLGPNYLPLLLNGKTFRSCINDSNAKPMPDKIITIRGICEKSLLKNGFPKNKINICGPIRNSKVIKIIHNKKIQAGTIKNKNLKRKNLNIFLACSADPKENTALIYVFYKALETLPNLTLILKPHPACKFPKRLFQLLRIHPKINNLRLASDLNFHHKICRSDVVVTGGSTLAFEAIALGVMPVVYESPAVFSACSMQSFRKSIIIVQSAVEMTQGILVCWRCKKKCLKRIRTWPKLCKNLSMTYLKKCKN
jgi:hypothetical protein